MNRRAAADTEAQSVPDVSSRTALIIVMLALLTAAAAGVMLIVDGLL